MNLTRLIYKLVFERRYKQIQRYATEASQLQHYQLTWLVAHAADTAFGQKYGFKDILTGASKCSANYEEFSKRVPLSTYDEQKPWIERMLQGEENVLWPGLCTWFAKSSGTTSDKSIFACSSSLQ